jgi:hypothetical protein
MRSCAFSMQIGEVAESEWSRLYDVLERECGSGDGLPFHSLQPATVRVYEHNGNSVVARILAGDKLLGGMIIGKTAFGVKDTARQLGLEKYIVEDER